MWKMRVIYAVSPKIHAVFHKHFYDYMLCFLGKYMLIFLSHLARLQYPPPGVTSPPTLLLASLYYLLSTSAWLASHARPSPHCTTAALLALLLP